MSVDVAESSRGARDLRSAVTAAVGRWACRCGFQATCGSRERSPVFDVTQAAD